MMKNPSEIMGKTSEAGKQLLSRFSAVDELLIRPSSDENSAHEGSDVKSASRIALHRYQELEQQIRNHPANPAPYLELAQIYLDQNRFRDAVRVLDQGVAHNPESDSLQHLREEALLANAHQALVEARKVADFQSTESAKRELEMCEIDLANMRAKVCESRYRRHPDQTELLIPWAVALRQLGRLDECVACLQKAAQEPSLRARAHLQLGMAYQHSGQILPALTAYRQAALFRAPLPPKDIRCRALELAYELAKANGLIDSARAYGERLLREKPEFADSLRSQLKILEQQPL